MHKLCISNYSQNFRTNREKSIIDRPLGCNLQRKKFQGIGPWVTTTTTTTSCMFHLNNLQLYFIFMSFGLKLCSSQTLFIGKQGMDKIVAPHKQVQFNYNCEPLLSTIQWDQIGRFLKVLDNNFLSKVVQIFGDFWDCVEMMWLLVGQSLGYFQFQLLVTL